MKASYLLSLFFLSHTILAKNVVDLKGSKLSKRGPKKLSHAEDLRISQEEFDKMFPNPLKKRSGIIIEPDLQVVEGSVEEINEKQRLFEQGYDVPVGQINEEDNEQVHIANNEDASTSTLGNLLNSNDRVRIFSSYARSVSHIDTILNDARSDVIIMSPIDDAIASLPLKPWEYPNPITEDNNEKDETSDANIDIFTKSHIIVDSLTQFQGISDDESGATSVLLKTLNNVEVELSKTASGEFQVTVKGYDDIVINVVDVGTVDNGVLLVIDHVLEWPGM